MSDDPDRQHATAERSPRIVRLATPEPISPFDQLKAALAEAPDDDEPLTDNDRATIDAGWEDYRQGRTITLDELRRTEPNEAG